MQKRSNMASLSNNPSSPCWKYKEEEAWTRTRNPFDSVENTENLSPKSSKSRPNKCSHSESNGQISIAPDQSIESEYRMDESNGIHLQNYYGYKPSSLAQKSQGQQNEQQPVFMVPNQLASQFSNIISISTNEMHGLLTQNMVLQKGISERDILIRVIFHVDCTLTRLKGLESQIMERADERERLEKENQELRQKTSLHTKLSVEKEETITKLERQVKALEKENETLSSIVENFKKKSSTEQNTYQNMAKQSEESRNLIKELEEAFK